MANELDAIQPQAQSSYDDSGNELDQLQANGNSQAPQLPSTLSNTPENQPQQPQQAPTGQQDVASSAPQSMWKRILVGAFAGLANSAGAHNWGQALGEGAGGVLKANQQAFDNQQQEAQNQSQIKFRDAQSAYNAAMLSAHQKQVDTLQGAQRRQAQQFADQQAINAQMKGYKVRQIAMGGSGQDATVAELQQRDANNGGQGADVNGFMLHGPDSSYVIDFGGADGPAQEYQHVRGIQNTFGIAPTDRSFWMGNPKQRDLTSQKAYGVVAGRVSLDGKPYTKANENQLDADLKTAQENVSQLKSNADADPDDLANWQSRLTGLQAQKGGMSQVRQDNQQEKIDLSAYRNRLSQILKATPGAPKADASGGRWLPGATADEKKKAELAENIAYNGYEVNHILQQAPNTVGVVAGRFTNVEQMTGNDDPNISALGNAIHNIAMANSGVHGFRSQEGVKDTEQKILNSFKNGPNAIMGAINTNVGSVQTFIDDARPTNFPTHSVAGGASKFFSGGYRTPLAPQQQQAQPNPQQNSGGQQPMAAKYGSVIHP